jgi:hypothetical protein
MHMPTETEVEVAHVLGAQQSASATSRDSELQKLNEQELKAAIKSAWKKHEQLAKQDLAPLLYWLRERLRAQGSRNDLVHDKDRGWEVWVTEHLDISRRTADRWCAWYAEKARLTPEDSTSGQVPGSDDPYEDILNQHKSKQQIVVNCWVETAIHVQYKKALLTIQTKFGLKNTKEALVQGVIYAAKIIASTSETGRGRKRISTRRTGRLVASGNGRRTGVGTTTVSGGKNGKRTVHGTSSVPHHAGTNGHGGEGSSKPMRAAAGR